MYREVAAVRFLTARRGTTARLSPFLTLRKERGRTAFTGKLLRYAAGRSFGLHAGRFRLRMGAERFPFVPAARRRTLAVRRPSARRRTAGTAWAATFEASLAAAAIIAVAAPEYGALRRRLAVARAVLRRSRRDGSLFITTAAGRRATISGTAGTRRTGVAVAARRALFLFRSCGFVGRRLCDRQQLRFIDGSRLARLTAPGVCFAQIA